MRHRLLDALLSACSPVEAQLNSDNPNSKLTGKSQLIRQIKQELQNKSKTFACLAPTNLAAINIKGTTVHKFVSKLKKMDSLYNLDVDYLFIDEISMLQENFLL